RADEYSLLADRLHFRLGHDQYRPIAKQAQLSAAVGDSVSDHGVPRVYRCFPDRLRFAVDVRMVLSHRPGLGRLRYRRPTNRWSDYVGTGEFPTVGMAMIVLFRWRQDDMQHAKRRDDRVDRLGDSDLDDLNEYYARMAVANEETNHDPNR